MAGKAGNGERVCLLPARREAFPAELTLHTPEARRQLASPSCTGPPSGEFRDPLAVLAAPQPHPRLHGHPRNGHGGDWGAWKRRIRCISCGERSFCVEDPSAGMKKPRAGSGGGGVSRQPSPLPGFVQAAGEGEGGRRAVPGSFLSRSEPVPRACGEPGLVCCPRQLAAPRGAGGGLAFTSLPR